MSGRAIAWPVVMSLAAHAAVLGWLSTSAADCRDRTNMVAPEPAPDEPEPAESQLVEVDLLAAAEPRTETGAAIQPALPPDDGSRSSPAELPPSPPGLAIDPGSEPTGGEPTTAADSDQRTDDVDRRRRSVPGARELARSIAGDPGPTPIPSPLAPPRPRRPPQKPPSEIRPDGKGAYRADDLTFHAKIGRDGRVEIEDKPNFHAHLKLPTPGKVGRGLERWYQDPYGTSPKDERSVETATVPIVGGGFDLTDWAVRAGGGDPYYHRKQKFFERTRAERSEMALRARNENLRDAVRGLNDHLETIWRYQLWSAERRRRALFELWDECAEVGSAEVIDAANAARATIEAFTRKRLPAGSQQAFSSAELTELNGLRQSKRLFRPYRH